MTASLPSVESSSRGEVRPLFPDELHEPPLPIPCLGRIPFDPELARLSDRGLAVTELAAAGTDGGRRPFTELHSLAFRLLESLEEKNR